jgi:hypothetical protein
MHFYLTWISAIYILSGLIGLVISLIAMPRYWFTYRAGKKLTVDMDRQHARLVNMGVIITESLRFSIHFLTTSIGAQSLLISPTASTTTNAIHKFFGFEIVVILLWANIATTINSTIVYVQYRLLRSHRRERMSDRHMIAKLRWQVRRLGRRQRGVVDRADEIEQEQVVQNERIEAVERAAGVSPPREAEPNNEYTGADDVAGEGRCRQP